MDKIKVLLNDKEVFGEKDETILSLCRKNGIEIPTLCHDDRLKPYSSCFLCVVEVEGLRTLTPSCSTKIYDGIKVTTDNDRIAKSRKTALDLLLSDHYADCTAPCTTTCPAGVDVQGYIALIDKGMHSEAVKLIKERNPLPAICGRVCVRPCEATCRRNLIDEVGVGIDYLKRYSADKDLISTESYRPELKADTGKKVTIIGAGPAGLTAAYFLAKEGHKVEIIEANPHGGGMLRYGIPGYRLPNELLDTEIETIKDLGVTIKYDTKFGTDVNYKDLKENSDAVILTIGSQKGSSMRVENENADPEHVLSGIDYLRNMELTGIKYNFKGKKVATIGGGNTAMDCCRSAFRCGAEKSYVIYRRTEKEMPANPIEIHESRLEGIEYLFLTAPTKVNTDENGKLKSLTCLKMELGEPDSSGRRRPVPVEGSEFEIELDYILGAIGQKTDVDFIENVNSVATDGEFKINRWGDIDTDEKTLQTGVKSIFAAGDGVTGAATLIEAVNQGRIAAKSCNQFLKNEEITGDEFNFVSIKDNFSEQTPEDYKKDFFEYKRNEMPVLPEDDRLNPKEVELGYTEDMAKDETERCLECGCSEYFTCDLQKYSTEYNVEQKKFSGEFKKSDIKFDHPYIEIDNNKCILCSRCIRICDEVANVGALGLVNRGFSTFVAPSLGDSLLDTKCESCGLCVDTCPTGALLENTNFKPGPFETSSAKVICNYCSVGCELDYNHRDGFVVKVTGSNGLINSDGNICRMGKFGYEFLNCKERITKPLLKDDTGKFNEISFDEAFKLIADNIKKVDADENSFFAGARLTNEELYLTQKLARGAVKTNNVSSFHYMDRLTEGYLINSAANTPFTQIDGAKNIYLLGSSINSDNPVVGYMINNHKFNNPKDVKITLLSKCNCDEGLSEKCDETLEIKSYYYFVKAVNHYLLSEGKENALFLNDNCVGFELYKQELLKENYSELLEKAGATEKLVSGFATEYNNSINAIIVHSEKKVSSNVATEIQNLAMITGKLGKTASGLISLKEKNNSHGVLDMGIIPELGVALQDITSDDYISKMESIWKVTGLNKAAESDQKGLLASKKIKNIFILGEDPIGTYMEEDKDEFNALITGVDFKVTFDNFKSSTAEASDLIMPLSLPFETGGSYTNTQKFYQPFSKSVESKIEKKSTEQLMEIISLVNTEIENNVTKTESEISLEAVKFLPTGDEIDKANEESAAKFSILSTDGDNKNRMFDNGCDGIHDYLNVVFKEKLGK